MAATDPTSSAPSAPPTTPTPPTPDYPDPHNLRQAATSDAAPVHLPVIPSPHDGPPTTDNGPIDNTPSPEPLPPSAPTAQSTRTGWPLDRHEQDVPKSYLPRPLTAQQANAIELICLGHTDAEVAMLVNAHRTTVSRWRLYNHVFQAELSRRRQEVWGSAGDQFRRVIGQATLRLTKQLGSDDELVAYRAAARILTLAARGCFAPPELPEDPVRMLDHHARRFTLRNRTTDPTLSTPDDRDREDALLDLRLRERLHTPPDPDAPDHPYNDSSPATDNGPRTTDHGQ